MTTPLNSPEFDKIRTDAIKKSEAQAEALGKKDHFSDVIDTRAEVDAFFDIAYKSIDAKLKQTKDPRLQQKIVELKAVYASKEAIRGKYYRHNEKIADEYWQELISVFEQEERAAIKHGPDFFKSLGIDGQVSLEKFDTEEGEIKYHMKKDSVNFTLLFKKDGQMKMTAYVNRNDWLHFIKSAPRKFIRGDYREIVQSVSLMELRDLSAFQLHFSRYNSSSLQSLLRELSNDLHKLPKRTTNPNLKPLIAFRDEMDALSAEISKEAKNSSYNLTEEKINSYKQKIESFFERRLIDLNAMDPSSEEAKKLAEILEGIVEENPMLIEVVTRNAKSPQDLAEWDVRNSWEQPYLHHEIETKRSELSNASNSTLTKMTAFKQLSPKHKEVCKKILLKGLISTKNSKKIDAYLRYLNGISKEILSEYSSYVNEIQLERFLANPEYLAKFTRYAKGLNYSQFRVYCHLWKENKYGEQFKESATILKDYKNEEDLDIVKILITVSTDKVKVQQLMREIKNLITSGKIKWSKLKSYLKAKPYYCEKILFISKHLDKEFLAQHQVFLLKNVVSLQDLEIKDLKAMNKLNPVQRNALNYFGNTLERNVKKLRKFVEILSKIENKEQLAFIKRKALIPVIDRELYKTHPTRALINASPTVDKFVEIAEESNKHKAYWNAVSEYSKGGEKREIWQGSYELVDLMVERGLTEQEMIKTIPYIFSINSKMQLFTVQLLFKKDNYLELFKTTAECQKKCGDLWYQEELKNNYYKVLNLEPPVTDINKIIDLLVEAKNQYTSDMFIVRSMVNKASSIEDFYQMLSDMTKPNFVKGIKEILTAKYTNLNDYNGVSNLIYRYFTLTVSTEDLKHPRRFFREMKKFIEKADKENYNHKTDPDSSKALLLLGADKILAKEDGSFTHLAFILNVLQDSSPEFSRTKLLEWAKAKIDDPKALIKEKAAKIIIGLGDSIQNYNAATVKKIAKAAVDSNISKFVISDDIKKSHLVYLAGAGSKSMPMSVYFSILINLQQQKKPGDETIFKSLADKYFAIEGEKVYGDNVLVLAHNVNDTNHSFLFASDSFSPESHQGMAEAQGSKVEVLRHGKNRESVESMLSKLETTEGDLQLVIGGHGNVGIISFGSESFYMNALFERLAKRLEAQKSGNPWRTEIIFESCHSSMNIENLMAKWTEDERTKDHGVRMLSSSSEDEGSAKMAGDSWVIKGRKVIKSKEPLTWGGLYRDIESRNFVMGKAGSMNSNMTLYENGKRLF